MLIIINLKVIEIIIKIKIKPKINMKKNKINSKLINI